MAAADRAMLIYVEKLTLRPWEMVREDVITLRAAGFSDAAILDINQVTGYYAYANYLFDVLGVDLEPFWNDSTDLLHDGGLSTRYQGQPAILNLLLIRKICVNPRPIISFWEDDDDGY